MAPDVRKWEDRFQRLRDWQDSRRDMEVFNAFEQRFVEALEIALENIALSSEFNCPTGDILEQYHANREHILEQFARENVADEQRVIDILVDELVDIITEELDEDIDEHELKKAVEVAHRETINKFITEADTNDQLQLWITRDIQEGVDTIVEDLTDLKQQLKPRPGLIGRQERYRLLYPTDADWVDVLSATLGLENERQELPFLPPDGFSTVTDPEAKRVLLAGRKGAGKSRTLFEGIVKLESAVEFDRVVVITQQVAEPSDLSKAFQDVTGNALLVFDDLQQSAKNNFDIGDALTELEQRISPHDLYVRAATRSEDLDTVLPSDYEFANLTGRRDQGDTYEQWTAFHAERLPPLEGERLEQFVGAALEFQDITAPMDLREAFVEAVTERDPTPFYVMSVCSNAGDRLTRHEFENLPANAVGAWKRAYARLNREQQTLLHTILVLDLLDVPKRQRVITTLYESDVFHGEKGSKIISELAMLGWLAERGRGRRQEIVIHDVRLEAVKSKLIGEETLYASRWEFFEQDIFLELSEFLLESKRIDRGVFGDDLGALLNANFAELVYKQEIGPSPVEDAQQHFERATDVVSESAQVFYSYYRFLERTGNGGTEKRMELLEEGLEHDPNTPEVVRSRVQTPL